jgi:hypothetical protein
MEQILLTESGTHAVDLLCRFLLKPGDCVLVDDPSYFNYHALLKAHQVQAIGVPYTHSGPDLEAFAQALQAHSPRLYITNSGLHNPTGAVLSASTAPPAGPGRTQRTDHRRGRHLRRLRTAAGAAAGRARWAVTGDPRRQFLQDAVGSLALRLHRCAP